VCDRAGKVSGPYFSNDKTFLVVERGPPPHRKKEQGGEEREESATTTLSVVGSCELKWRNGFMGDAQNGFPPSSVKKCSSGGGKEF